MTTYPYDRAAAVAYARQWAFARNPAYGDFSDMGGDCSNFISQALAAGGAAMSEGWHYYSLQKRTPSWSGVPFLHDFLVGNRGRGPFGRIVPLEQAQPGDIIQLKFAGMPNFSHSLLVVQTEPLLIACHSYDSLDRPLDTYSFVQARAIHIEGVRR